MGTAPAFSMQTLSAPAGQAATRAGSFSHPADNPSLEWSVAADPAPPSMHARHPITCAGDLMNTQKGKAAPLWTPTPQRCADSNLAHSRSEEHTPELQ